MQHPVGYAIASDGTLRLADFSAFLLNPWALAQYACS
jgi:cytochrome d ubiquinol oxidase subunit I